MSVPLSRPSTGSSNNAAKMMSIIAPPELCTHFPTDSPMVDATIIMVRITAVAPPTNHVLDVIHAALGPNA